MASPLAFPGNTLGRQSGSLSQLVPELPLSATVVLEVDVRGGRKPEESPRDGVRRGRGLVRQSELGRMDRWTDEERME